MAETDSKKPADKPESSREKTIGIYIAVIAVILALNSAFGNSAGSDEIISRVEASNTWARYQAKKIRETQTDLARDLVLLDTLGTDGAEKAAGTNLISRYGATISRYKAENDTISAEANAHQAAADKAQRQGDMHDIADLFLQTAIVLCSVSILADQDVFHRIGIAIALFGIGVGIYAFFV